MAKFLKTLVRTLLMMAVSMGVLFFALTKIPDKWLGDSERDSSSDTAVPVVSETPEAEASPFISLPFFNTTDENEEEDSSSGVEITTLSDSEEVRESQDYSGSKTVTVLCYMNGSNLESEDGQATADIGEMLSAPCSSNVNIVIQTMGTRKWSTKYGISSSRSQRWLLQEDSLKLVDDSLSQLDCTDASTLSDFISWGAANYPADRYILLFWDHGGGPIYGFGYDEFQSSDAAMTIDEMQLAVNTAGVYFDFIGMDCCIMSCMEVCCALYDSCDYMILSEDFESGLGWSYKGWLTKLAADPGIDTYSLGKIIVDDFVSANETSRNGDSGILAVIDESVMRVLYSAWKNFAYANEDALLENNYSRGISRRVSGRILPRMDSRDDYSLSDYYITDIMALAKNIDSEESSALASAVANAVVYCNSTADSVSLTGLSVTLPYGDRSFYASLKTIFTNCGFDSEYIEWLGSFVSASGSSSYYSYDSWDSLWDSWDSYEDDYDWNSWDSWDNQDYWSNDDNWGWSGWDYSDYWGSDWRDYGGRDYYDGRYF